MAVPKNKVSKSRRDKRRSSVWKLETPSFTRCGNCGELILPHKVCKNCGFYKGVEVVSQGGNQ
jgi:large subunit ribosomal protein L32